MIKWFRTSRLSINNSLSQAISCAVTIADVSGTASPLETSVGLVKGCTYALKVRAQNEEGYGPYHVDVEYLALGVPAAPQP